MRYRSLALLASTVLAIGCGGRTSSSGDATGTAPPDVDAGLASEQGPNGAPPSVGNRSVGVTVTVVDGLVPKANVRVLFHDSTGAIVGEAATDASGKVARATAPSMVTVLTKDYGPRPAAVTFLAVTDGDNLRVGNRASTSKSALPGFVDVTFSGANIAGASDFFIAGAGQCGAPFESAAAGVRVGLNAECGLGPTNAVLATASSASSVVGFAFAKHITAPSASGAAVHVGPLVFTAPGTTKVTASHLRSAPGIENSASLYAVADERAFLLPGSGVIGAGGLDFPSPTGFADAYETELTAVGDRGGQTTLVRRDATSAPASAVLADIDFSNALPFITDVAITASDPARPDVTITTEAGASLASADVGFLSLDFDFLAPSMHSWTFVVPPGTVAFKAPALPADATGYLATQGPVPVRANIVRFF
ncbi:MAG: hypothetical protein JWP87_5345, partial [Labilithrix sp.]|nr:hypothetical protein [Labilithrix sp.]